MKSEFNYSVFTQRNHGYVPDDVQEKIKNTKVLIAGCGIGSAIAETATRVGFQNITLIDGDTIEPHNLNRQDFRFEDIGRKKVDALKDRILAINPTVNVKAIPELLTKDNVVELVSANDIIFDTIDFLSLEDIIALHDEALKQKKHLISTLSMGWGAGLLYFPPGTKRSFREAFEIKEGEPIDGKSYVQHFRRFVDRMSSKINQEVITVVKDAIKIMEDGKPCPAPQTSSGAFMVGSLAVTSVVLILKGIKITEAPEMIIIDPTKDCLSPGVNVL